MFTVSISLTKLNRYAGELIQINRSTPPTPRKVQERPTLKSNISREGSIYGDVLREDEACNCASKPNFHLLHAVAAKAKREMA